MLRRFLRSTPLTALVLALVALTLTACAQKSPEERVAEARTKYKVALNAFLPQDPEPVIDEDMTEDAMPEEGAEASETAVAAEVAAAAVAAEGEEGEEGEEGMAEESEEMTSSGRDVFFDLIVQFDGPESLPGITVEITHADPFEKEKASFRHYLETGTMVKSETKQVSFTVPGLDFVDGDLFSVDVRAHVPAEERGEYREFAESGFE